MKEKKIEQNRTFLLSGPARNFELILQVVGFLIAGHIYGELQMLVDQADPITGLLFNSYQDLKRRSLDFRNEVQRLDVSDADLDELVSNIERSVKDLFARVSRDPKPSTTTPLTIIEAKPKSRIDRVKLELPHFNGEAMKWPAFEDAFSKMVMKDGSFSPEDKALLLLKSVTTTETKRLVEAQINAKNYDGVFDTLKARFGIPKSIYREHFLAASRKYTIGLNKRDLLNAVDTWEVLRLGLQNHSSDPFENLLGSLLESHLDQELSQKWTDYSSATKSPPTVKEILAFFLDKAQTSIPAEPGRKSQSTDHPSSSKSKKVNVAKVNPQCQTSTNSSSAPNTHSRSSHVCPACGKGCSSLNWCETFKTWDLSRRSQLVHAHKRCLNCLSPGHKREDCRSRKNCFTCGQRHNTLLHEESQTTPQNQLQPSSAIPNTAATPVQPSTNSKRCARAGQSPTTLYTTAIANASFGDRTQQIRVFFDSGSGITLVTEDLVSRLQAFRERYDLSFSGVTGNGHCKHKVWLKLSSIYEDVPEYYHIECHVVPRIDPVESPHNKNYILSDPNVTKCQPLSDPTLGGSVDMLVSQDDYVRLQVGGLAYAMNHQVMMMYTKFGWVLGGSAPGDSQDNRVYRIALHDDPSELDLQLLWELEKVPSSESNYSTAEQQALDNFQDSHRILPSGRFSVSLPRKESAPVLGESRSTAIKRFLMNEKALERKNQFSAFTDVLKEYLTLGHAEPVPLDELHLPASATFYLPVHGVAKESSTTTKLRAVFDASAKSKSGCSLNDQLLSGPNLYPLLSSVLLRFRLHQVAFTADISKMFREIALNEEEWNFHRFLMRNDNGHLQDFRMNRLTFGVKSSPFLATQVLRQLASDYQTQYPDAARTILEDFYVDDCISGASTVEEATKTKEQLLQLLSSAGMLLRKWRSNSPQFLQTVPIELQETAGLKIADPSASAKALGICWDVSSDNFYVSTPTFNSVDRPTKRIVASSAARVFDVLGFYSPSVLPVKIILQQLWKLGCNWDDSIPDNLADKWKEWSTQIERLSSHPIPRLLFDVGQEIRSVQLHGFSDASNLAYGAVVYLRVLYEDLHVSVTLVFSKARVAPLKEQTIPRLELCAAHLLAKILSTTADVLRVSPDNVYAWVDSMIALCWIRKSSSTLKTFVANRVSNIQALLPPEQWRYVPTTDNPADLASRGVLPDILISSSLWWQGPEWLHETQEYWPALPIGSLPKNLPDLKPIPVLRLCPTLDPLFSRYSSFHRLCRVLGWCFRFINKARKLSSSKSLPLFLTTTELMTIKTKLLRLSQEETHLEYIDLISQGKSIPPSSSLSKLDVNIGEESLLRVSGRVRDTLQPTTPKSYILLSTKSSIARLLLTTLHQDLSHAGPSVMLSVIAETYHIVNVKQFVKGLCRSCVTCQKAQAQTQQQRMGMLPLIRTTPAPPFHHIGLDYAGPVYLRQGSARRPVKVKAYICLFVCMVTRAIHLELCTDLSTESFMAALSRFIGRRGIPESVNSDNGTTFQGAARDLKDLYKFLDDKKTQGAISEYCAKDQIRWSFSPPRAPHFGGLWEAGVRIMKAQLRKVLPPHLLTYEQLSTILIDVEAILNSRPILPIDSTDPDGPNALTAGHFIIQRPLKSLPTATDSKRNIGSLRRWNLVKRISADIWSCWLSRYLQSVQSRSKWSGVKRNFDLGDIVLLKDEALHTRSWPLGKVVQVYPGSDGLVRVVDLLLNGKKYKRATNRLVLLVPNETVASPREDVQAQP